MTCLQVTFLRVDTSRKEKEITAVSYSVVISYASVETNGQDNHDDVESVVLSSVT